MLVEAFFFFNDTATTEIYTLSLHDALPILVSLRMQRARWIKQRQCLKSSENTQGTISIDISRWQNKSLLKPTDRKSTRLNSSHANISYAVFCLKKKHHFYVATI